MVWDIVGEGLDVAFGLGNTQEVDEDFVLAFNNDIGSLGTFLHYHLESKYCLT